MTQYPESDHDAFGHWLAGFVDGEGHFRLSRCTRDRNYSCGFTIRLRADDRATLKTIREFIGHGRLYEYETKGPHPISMLNVSSRIGCTVVADLFTSYPLRSKKAVDFLIWKQAVEIWSSMRALGHNGSTGQADWAEMESLWYGIRAQRRFAA